MFGWWSLRKKKKRLWSVHPFVFVFVLSLLQCRTHTEHCPCKPKSWNETGMEQSCLRLLSSLPFYNLLIKQTSQKHHHPSTHFCQRTDIVLLHAIVTTTDPSSNTYTGINTVGHNVTAQTSAHLQRHCTDISLPSTCTSSTSRQLTAAITIKLGMASMSLFRQYLLAWLSYKVCGEDAKAAEIYCNLDSNQVCLRQHGFTRPCTASQSNHVASCRGKKKKGTRTNLTRCNARGGFIVHWSAVNLHATVDTYMPVFLTLKRRWLCIMKHAKVQIR